MHVSEIWHWCSGSGSPLAAAAACAAAAARWAAAGRGWCAAAAAAALLLSLSLIVWHAARIESAASGRQCVESFCFLSLSLWCDSVCVVKEASIAAPILCPGIILRIPGRKSTKFGWLIDQSRDEGKELKIRLQFTNGCTGTEKIVMIFCVIAVFALALG